MAGTVVEGDESTSFDVTDGGADIPVVLDGPKPSLFAEEVPLCSSKAPGLATRSRPTRH